MASSNCFFLPDTGNNITKLDIEKGILRITSKAKCWFPQTDTLLKIKFNDTLKEGVSFKKRNGRSDILYIGKDFMNTMEVSSKSKLKITQVTPNEFLIENGEFLFSYQETNNISYGDLKELKKKYWLSLRDCRFPPPPENGNPIEMIHYFKRKVSGTVHSIGPYTGLSVLEAANRIASDLVIINGILQLIDHGVEPQTSSITIRLGNSHKPGTGDFTINNKEGEAFNVASSFYKVKLRSTNQKWIEGGLHYILINADVFDEISSERINSKIIKVIDWDKHK